MFGLFNKRSKASPDLPLLKLDDEAFLAAVCRSVQESNPPSLSMWLVALQNLRTYESLWLDAARRQNTNEFPQTGDGFICWLAVTADSQPDDLGKRRAQWFFLAAVLDRASWVAQRTPRLIDQLASMWVDLASAGAQLPKVYRENRLWPDDEKEWFSHLTDGRSGIDFVLNFMAPNAVRKHSKIRALADEYNIYVSQSPGRLA